MTTAQEPKGLSGAEKEMSIDDATNMICAIWADLKGITDKMTDKRRARLYERVLAYPILHERIPLKNEAEHEVFAGLLIIQEYNNAVCAALKTQHESK